MLKRKKERKEWTNRPGERHVEKEERKKRVDKQTRGKAWRKGRKKEKSGHTYKGNGMGKWIK